jgi:hypothetical protein
MLRTYLFPRNAYLCIVSASSETGSGLKNSRRGYTPTYPFLKNDPGFSGQVVSGESLVVRLKSLSLWDGL